MESFSLDEAGEILGENPEEVERAILEAQRAIETELISRVLIIEDEPIIALDLENLVTELGHDVVGTAATREQAVKLAIIDSAFEACVVRDEPACRVAASA